MMPANVFREIFFTSFSLGDWVCSPIMVRGPVKAIFTDFLCGKI
jgi:hypothetical protein